MLRSTVENVQEIIRLASARAIAEMTQGAALIAASSGPEDALLANGAIVDGDWNDICLFDDDATGFDNEEAGFA